MDARKLVIGGWLLMAGAMATPLAAAAEQQSQQPHQHTVCPICGRATDEAPYSEKAAATLARGLTNTVFGWTEVIRRPAAEAKAGGSVLMGIGSGVTRGVTRTLGGLGEMLTFWTPRGSRGYLRFSRDCPLCMQSHSQK